MPKTRPGFKPKKPTSIFKKPLVIDYKELLKALAKGIGHVAIAKWEELAADTGEALAALGVLTQPDELAFLLIKRSLIKSIFELIGDSASHLLADTKESADSVLQRLDSKILLGEVYIDNNFLDRPAEISIIGQLQNTIQLWLVAYGINNHTAKAIVGRLPDYFVYALNQEWRQNAKNYQSIIEALNTPFAKASARQWAWMTYAALLQRNIQTSIFDEPFSLSQVFILPNAYYEEGIERDSLGDISRSLRQRQRVVVRLLEELEQWLESYDVGDVIRVISGGPGSGKSSFARILAARVAHNQKQKVLFVPLHLIDAAQDLVDEVGRFIRDEGVLVQNPLVSELSEPNLLIIFDGLDELASQGKAAAETARSFIREVERLVEKRNLQGIKLRALISGRELVVQENESEFRHRRQVLTLLPYYIPGTEHQSKLYKDDSELLKVDLRQNWWQNYGKLLGKEYKGLPDELNRDDLDEITSQPLLNYLVALSFTRDKLDFTKDINLNSIYADFVMAVHERGYEKRRPFVPIRHMKFNDFSRVLEEIGLAAWHGDGRTTTVREIEEHCRASGLGSLLDTFQDGAKAGVTRLLAAFFFRQFGHRATGDPTFVFTHKTFGEYLAARRLIRGIDRIARELNRRIEGPDEGWDERDALKYWVEICGPSPISRYLRVFLLNEIKLHSHEYAVRWQAILVELFSSMLRYGMPMERLQITPFRYEMFQSRNAEEALLVALNACAHVTQKVSYITHPNPVAFGEWFKRIQGQRINPDPALVAECLSLLDMRGIFVPLSDFYSADLRGSLLDDISAEYANLIFANLLNAKMESGHFYSAKLARAMLINASLSKADLSEADLSNAELMNADLSNGELSRANFLGANLVKANLSNANLEGADFTGAKLGGADLRRANLEHANFRRADLTGADFRGAKFEYANFEGANLDAAKTSKSRSRGGNIDNVAFSKK